MNKSFTPLDDDCVKRYFKDIKKIKMLTPEEEIEITNKVKNGDKKAMHILVTANLKFVISIAKGYQNQGLPLSDLINEGNEGLIKAANRFDPSRGFKFISYAVWWVKQTIIQALNDNARTVRLPVNVINQLSLLKKKSDKFQTDNERMPIEGEVIGINKHGTIQFETIDNPFCTSLNNYIDEDKNEYSELIVDETFKTPDQLSRDEILVKKKLLEMLDNLSPREKDIIECYYGVNRDCEAMTLEAIGDRYELSKERIRQIKSRAIRKLRHHIDKLATIESIY